MLLMLNIFSKIRICAYYKFLYLSKTPFKTCKFPGVLSKNILNKTTYHLQLTGVFVNKELVKENF